MRKEVFKRGPLLALISTLAPILFTFVVIAIIVFGLEQTEQAGRAEGLRLLEEGLMRAAVTCYVAEGRYPDSVAYIEEHYGVRIDRTKYVVHYDMFASNILPDISVIELSREGE